MREINPRSDQTPRGLNTSRDVRSSALVYEEYLNARSGESTDLRRKGMARLYRFTAPSSLVDFDGTDDLIQFGTGTTLIGSLTTFTLEALWVNDTVAASSFVLGRNAAANVPIKIEHTSSSTVVTTITDSAGTASTTTHTGIGAGVACAWQLVRVGSAVTVKINGTSQTTTMNATNAVAAGTQQAGGDNGASFFNGALDFFRGFRTAKTSQMDGWTRLLNPYATAVLFDFLGGVDANGVCVDRSRVGRNHGTSTGSPTSARAPVAVNPAPILAIASNKDNDALRQSYVRAGGIVYPLEV